MKKNAYIISLILLFLVSCTRYTPLSLRLDLVDEIINQNPDSAFRILDDSKDLFNGAPEAEQMRYRVLMVDAQNKLDMKMPTDSTFFDVVEYYDNYGTSNQQMKVHYLLGCIYRGMREAPTALQCYYDAVEKADTLSGDCDNLSLMCVWGQIAMVLHSQNIIEKQIEALNRYCDLALKINSLGDYATGLQRMSYPYLSFGDTISAISCVEKAIDAFNKIGYKKDAASLSAMLIPIYINRGEYDVARQHMQIVEKESDMFDENHEITHGREHYYFTIGSYYLATNQLDSASCYFRKAISKGVYVDGYEGLLSVFQEKRNSDSILLYSKLYKLALEERQRVLKVDAIVHTSSMYDYNRYKSMSENEKLKSENRTLLFTIAFMVFVITATYLFLLYRKKIRRKNHEMKEEVMHYKNLQQENEEVIETMIRNVDEYRTMYENQKMENQETLFYATDIAKIFQESQSFMSDSDWAGLIESVREYMPLLYRLLMQNTDLSIQERHVCILVRMSISTSQIMYIMGVNNTQHVSTIKRNANKKLFGENSASSLLRNIKASESNTVNNVKA